MNEVTKLIRWETPFTETQFPSVGLIISTEKNGADILKAIVAPFGIDKYPKYLVNFSRVIAFTCMEEAHAPEMDFASAEIEESGLCAYEFIDSPWLKTYEAWIPFLTNSEKNCLYHYLIFGGDNNVEVITQNEPEIEIINEQVMLKIEYSL